MQRMSQVGKSRNEKTRSIMKMKRKEENRKCIPMIRSRKSKGKRKEGTWQGAVAGREKTTTK